MATMKSVSDFETILRQYGPKIYTLCVRLCGNSADGDDLAQEVFIRAHRSLHQFRGDADLGTWLTRIAVNLWKNQLRSRRRRSFWKHFSLNQTRDEDDTPLQVADNSAPLDAAPESAETQAMVQNALSELDPEDRGILILRDLEDRPYEDIAVVLGVPLGTVKSRLARSREKLRILLQKRMDNSV